MIAVRRSNISNSC